MPSNQNSRRGPTQEERRRRAANRPLGGGGTPTQNPKKLTQRSKTSGVQQISAVIALVMLVAVLLSLLPSCIQQVNASELLPVVLTPRQDTPAPAISFGSARYLEQQTAEDVPTASMAEPASQDPSKLYVGETGHFIGGQFLAFWHAQGEADVLGLPLSETFIENNRTVQLFEKAFLELHPDESDPKNQVQLAFIGRQLADLRGLRFGPSTTTSNSATRAYFQETGQSVSGQFKTFWDKNNGLTLLGLPISGEIKEDGVTNQYFERGLLTIDPTDTTPQVRVAKAGMALLQEKGWSRPTRLNLQLDIAGTEIYQGRTLALRLEPDARWEPLDLRGNVGDEVLKLIKVDTTYRAFKAFAPWDDSKIYPLKLAYTDGAGRNRSLEKPIKVVKFDFDQQNLYLPNDKTELTDKSNDDFDNNQLASTYASFSSQIMWKGFWAWPTYGEITTNFGQRRTYGSGSDYDLYHGGLDIAQNLGTPVAAPADGKVAFTGKLLARGNAVAIDHGAGVTSYYYHLNSILVKPGDVLKKGQILGQVGTTGRSNGPHLHWEVRVNGQITYPLLFVKEDLSAAWS